MLKKAGRWNSDGSANGYAEKNEQPLMRNLVETNLKTLLPG
jgi:hypothetical protein